LEQQGLQFDVVPSDIDESLLAGESAAVHAERLALEKAWAVATQRRAAAVFGSDTIVVVDGSILGKPDDGPSAISMLERLSGRWHEVISAVALVCEERSFSKVMSACTRVRFRELGREEIEAYVESGEPLDKAGAYGIQALGALLVRGIEGCYFNVMGLPLQGVRRLMWEFADSGAAKERDGRARELE